MINAPLTPHRWPVYGHDWAVDHLRKSMSHGRARHAYLITGTESLGKLTLARAFAMTLNCTDPEANAANCPCGECRSCLRIVSGNHPDVTYAEHDATTGALKIEEIRRMTSMLALKPFEARHRIAIFPNFDRAQDRAQDALLKTLEEPPPNAVLILLAESTDTLLSTITSRSQVIPLRPIPAEGVYAILTERYQVEADHAHLLANLSAGRPGWAIRALGDSALLDQRTDALNMLEELLSRNRAGRFDLADGLSKDRLAIRPLLELWQTYWRDVLLLVTGSGLTPSNSDRIESLERLARELDANDALDAMQATRTTLENITSTNVNARLALEVMFLDYPGLARG
ncbi:MAG: DNA polymerase III subunit [Burkholderiales bacterium]|nr:DNA polymerase III subunit [Anaerolineae bacterium]